jgi:hypothetical protein
MVYSKARLKSTYDKASPCIRPLSIGNDMFTYMDFTIGFF